MALKCISYNAALLCDSRSYRFFALLLAFAVYLIGGALAFIWLEYALGVETRTDLLARKQGLVHKYNIDGAEIRSQSGIRIDRLLSFAEDELDEFLEAVIVAGKHGISALKNGTNEQNWSFGQSLFFSTTVVTTIGYGHIAPISDGGKIFCMVYALVGIPFVLVLLSATVDRLMAGSNFVLGRLNAKLGHLYQPFNIRLMHLVSFGK